MSYLETYLKDVRDTLGRGVAETSFYPALTNMFNSAGKVLTPAVSCTSHPKGQGAGIPDMGLYTPDQNSSNSNLKSGAVPSRGVVEVKGLGEDVRKIAHSGQVLKYLKKYRLVLVTNLREFMLVSYDPSNQKAVELQHYELAKDEAAFRRELGSDIQKMAQTHSPMFGQFLGQVLSHDAPIGNAQDVARSLAFHAREARNRLNNRSDLKSLDILKGSFEKALGVSFKGKDSDDFFLSTIVQTLFYGMFSAWVLWSKESNSSDEDFRWESARHYLSVPIIEQLFAQITARNILNKANLTEILLWTQRVLNRVDRQEFFKSFDNHEAVQYFYEPFLEAFDPELRKSYGVWYTPREVVRYMVERVDIALRDELGISDGLADDSVYVLDPCTGTGSFLLEVADKIDNTLQDKGLGDLVGPVIKEAFQKRIFGFELLPAPFVVAHLKLGLMLREKNAPLEDDERIAVYLTNALTGWNPEDSKPLKLGFPGFDEEVDAAANVKKKEPILVVLGNPPYDAFAGLSPKQEDGLVQPYKEGLHKEWGIKKFNLDDLYVRFFRIAERRIAEGSPGKGVLCYVSNFSYLKGVSFTVMREKLLRAFDSVWIDSLNGDSRETGKRTPEGEPDPSIFSTPYNRAGIKVGTTIATMIRCDRKEPLSDEQTSTTDTASVSPERRTAAVRHREFWGKDKGRQLVDSIKAQDDADVRTASERLESGYTTLLPEKSNRYAFRPWNASEDYLSWAALDELCYAAPENGLMEKRAGALIETDQKRLESRMRDYFDSEVDWSTLSAYDTGLTRDAARFPAKKTRKDVLGAEEFSLENIVQYSLRPFDTRWAYYSGVRPLWNEPRPRLRQQLSGENAFLVSRPASVSSPEGFPLYFTNHLGDNDSLRGHAYYIPMLWRDVRKRSRPESDDIALFDRGSVEMSTVRANLSEKALAYLKGLGVEDARFPDGAARLLWYHALAIGYSPRYLEENAGGIRDDWVRVPLPDTLAALEASARLGERVAQLLDTDKRVVGVDGGTLRQELRVLGVPSGISGDLTLDGDWGYRDARGVVMPGVGSAEAGAYSDDMRRAFASGAGTLGLSAEEMISALGGDEKLDVRFREGACWSNIPTRVWEFRIGGYQVIKKWLSYREAGVMGRQMTLDEVEYVSRMVRRIAGILLLGHDLDANYSVSKQNLRLLSPT